MEFALTGELQALRREVAEFAEREIVPHANAWDRDGAVPAEAIRKVAAAGYLGAPLPEAYGGRGLGQLAYGIVTEEIGKACASLRSLLTVHTSAVSETILRWGRPEQKDRWLPLLARGEKLAAFALSEPDVGSDARAVATAYQESEDHFELSGHKTWITFAQVADLFVVVARHGDQISAFLVERHSPGLEVIPLRWLIGTRASLLAELKLDRVKVPATNLLGVKGMGFLQVVNTALDNGRYSVACGSLGIARACLEASIGHARNRRQFGLPLIEHQLVRRKVADMITEVKASRLLCYNAGWLRDRKDPSSVIQTNVAKYHAARTAAMAASEAVQIHGARGLHDEHAVQRHYRDAKVMEIIEGTSEIQQLIISKYAATAPESILD